MSDMTLNRVEGFLGEALSWSGLRCRVNALFKQFDKSIVVIAHIPGRGQGLVRLTQLITDSFCDDVQLNQLDREGTEYKAVFILKPGALAGEAG